MNQLIENNVPAGQIKSIKEVFENDEMQKFVLKDTDKSGTTSFRTKSVAFDILN